MNTKICKYCGNNFEAKRSDAKFCSDKCRTSFFYQKKNPFKQKSVSTNILTDKKTGMRTDRNIQISGNVDFSEITRSIAKFEQELNSKYNKQEQLEEQSNKLFAEIAKLKDEAIYYENNLLLKIEQRLNLADDVLYNRYLNKKYLEAKQKNQNASDRLVSIYDISNSYFGKEMRKDILEYRTKLENKLAEINSKIQKDKALILQKEKEAELVKIAIKQCNNDIAFLQQRIFSYDKLLTGT